jgi:hypothetical protein
MSDATPSPTLSVLPLPRFSSTSSSEDYFVHIISNLLSTDECETLICTHGTQLSSNKTLHTNRLRHVFDDVELADRLWERLKLLYDDFQVVDEEGEAWTASGCNERFRFARYEEGKLYTRIRFTSLYCRVL